jgi:cytochrome c553
MISANLLAIHLFASICLLVAGFSVCSAGDVKAGRAKALMCQACHGMDGLSKAPDTPNIAAQIEPYIVAQLQAFKSGARKNDAMSVVAPSLPDTGHRRSCSLFFGNRDQCGQDAGWIAIIGSISGLPRTS